ncbi:MAG TPA: hypothetical protein PLE19_11340 [Planctomycetota bacterium]|nr:hypothetical protein [Planctomycetota bacterium]HRR82298.1 hypothetical protein [Planctomycetota bacterium]HRT95070.1 hypothetical protein [Planctomycetota bacterium]
MRHWNRLGAVFGLVLAPLPASHSTAAEQAPSFIWVEGEAARSNSMHRHPWWYDKVKKDQLSGGDFISNWSDKPGEATYAFAAPVARTWVLWVRANPVGTQLSYRLDGGDWARIDMSSSQVGNVNIAEDGKIDLRFLAWANVGEVKLAQGAHTIEFRMDSANNNHGMLDCFVFADAAFRPEGILKPGQLAAVAEAAEKGRWAFRPPRDAFSPDAFLDLRSLNEKVAGESGFVARSKDGNDFVLGNGRPARFWAVNSGAFDKDLARHARFLAKRGVNMVRFHSNITPAGNDLMGIDTKDRDHLWRGVAAMKKEGIYVTYSPYWAGPARVKPAMGVLDTGGNGNWGLLFFDKKLQDAYKAWMKQVLAEPNPYTGIPLAKDPALAIIQIQNEDSLLFYTSQGIKGAARKELRRQFGDFLKKKYGSLEKARETWGGAAPSADQDAPDDFAQGEAALLIVWELSQRRFGEGFQRRCSDQMEFFATVMRRFNKMIGDYLRNDLGCKQLVNAGNWRTADNVIMLDAERWSYSSNEVMAVNRYYGGIHEGQHNGWAIVNGDRFTDPSVLLRPRELPVTLKQVEGFPMIVSESSWVPPMSYQSEGPFLVAAYQSLNGVDAFYWFATGEEGWREPGSANGYLPSEGKWVCATPMLLGQWPAAALLYRKGYVRQGKPVVHEQRSLDDLWQRRMPIIAEDAGYDPNRDKDHLSKESNVKGGVNPLAYLVGPVQTTYGGNPARSQVADLSKFIDPSAKTVVSNTGELKWDYGRGLCKLNAPKAQGVTGFLKKAESIACADVTIQSGNDYATVLLVSMDDKPLATSGKVLVQVGTTQRPTGWKTSPVKIGAEDGEQVVDFGKAPWLIVEGDVRVTIRNPQLRTAVVLDPNGMAVKRIPLADSGTGKTLAFPPDALYVVLE